MRFPKFHGTLHSDGKTIYSYGHAVGRIEGDILQQTCYCNVTSQKHLNHAADHLGLKLRKPKNS